MTTACSYSQRMRHLSSLESMIYFSTSRKGYVCHRAVKGLLEIATKKLKWRKKKRERERKEVYFLTET